MATINKRFPIMLADGTAATCEKRGDVLTATLPTGQTPAPLEGYFPWHSVPTKGGNHWQTEYRGKWTTPAAVKARIKWAREPWREYCDWRPDDMPSRNGNPTALARLLVEHGARDTDLENPGQELREAA